MPMPCFPAMRKPSIPPPARHACGKREVTLTLPEHRRKTADALRTLTVEGEVVLELGRAHLPPHALAHVDAREAQRLRARGAAPANIPPQE